MISLAVDRAGATGMLLAGLWRLGRDWLDHALFSLPVVGAVFNSEGLSWLSGLSGGSRDLEAVVRRIAQLSELAEILRLL